MNLSRQDADLFFKLMWALQVYVNRQLKLIPKVKLVEDYVKLSSQEKLKVREALYQQTDLLEAFTTENPAGFSLEELGIVRSWKKFIAGNFYIERLLKRYAIFISAEETAQVYGVLGLYDSLEEVVYPYPPPIYVQAVLLPFKGRIIYDGLLMPYSISFGPGIRGDLNEIYQRAKQAGMITETLDPGASATKPRKAQKLGRDWRPVLDKVVETTEQLRQAESVVQTRAFGVLKASAKLAQAAAHEPNDLEALYQLARRTQTALRQLETALNRAE